MGFYRVTIDSPVDGLNSLAKEFVVFRQFSNSFYISTDPGVFRQHTWYRSTYDVLCIIVFGKENDFGKVEFEFTSRNTQVYTLHLII
jgi:hypothetical protein